MRRGPRPAKAKVRAQPPVARKPPTNDAARVRDLEKRLAEALRGQAEASKREAEAQEQQTATAEILHVISSSPTDTRPVLETVAEHASRVCGADDAVIFRVDGTTLRRVAHHGSIPPVSPTERPLPDRESVTGRAILDRRTVHILDIEATAGNEFPLSRTFAKQHGIRTHLAAPLLSKGAAIGAILIRRLDVRPFTSKQIALLTTFADQAVIAIENVRLFTELQEKNSALTEAHGQVTEALDQQTATSEILRVISRSPTDLQPVFDSIAASALRLCEAKLCTAFRFDGELIHLVGSRHVSEEGAVAYRDVYPSRPGRQSGTHRAILTRTIVHIPDIREDAEYELRALARANDYGCVLSVPMLRDGHPVGAITVGREAARPFTNAQIELLKTFADQAVIAIENVRLFNETKEALERQTATSEILRVIAGSPTEIQPVLDAIAENAARVCGANDAVIYRIEQGDVTRIVAGYGPIPKRRVGERGRNLIRESITGRAMLERQTVHVHDLQSEEGDEFPFSRELQRQLSNQTRTILATPLLREDVSIGAILIRRAEVQPFTNRQIALLQTFADQAVIAIENVRLFNETREALEQQTATAEILRVISSSPTDVQPVFDAIARSAHRLLSGYAAALLHIVGNDVHLGAYTTTRSEGDTALTSRFPLSIDELPRQNPSLVRVLLHGEIDHIPDVEDPSVGEFARSLARARGHRSRLMVPLRRGGTVVGGLAVTRVEPGRFSEDEIALLKTFADQAVIAIENVRLFNETKEALEQQTATSEILRIISTSPTDIQPVLDAVAESATRLCESLDAVILRRDGDRLRLVAHHGPVPFGPIGEFSFPLVRGSVAGRTVLDGRTVHVIDLQSETDEFPMGSAFARQMGFRTALCVPLMREGVAIGTIDLRRTESRPFAEREIELLKTFADQAVIAIENVRLFTELQEKNRALTQAHAQVTESLEQQTATAEILGIISQSRTDVQPVFDAIASSAMRLCGGDYASVFRVEGDQLVPMQTPMTPEHADFLRRQYPRPIDMTSMVGRSVIERRVVHVPDLADPSAPPRITFQTSGLIRRAQLTVPMLRNGEPVGVIAVSRREPGAFSGPQIELLKTFADQAVIAIENARLLAELQARTQELTRSVEQLTALGEVGRAVSSTLDLETVLTTIVSRAVQLSGLDGGVVFEYDAAAEQFEQRASTGQEALAEARRRARFRKGEGVVGRTAITHEPVQVPDITLEGAYAGPLRESLVESGVRALLAVPMLREGQLIGSLVVARNATGAFPRETVDMLSTFATQSALAIQNARLFREIEVKSRQLEVASQHKSEFLANMSHELRTPLNAIIGFSEVLTDRMFGELNEKQEEYLKDIYASGTHLLSLINDILDLSKIEAGRMELELTDFDLPTAIENALMLVRERAGRRSIALHTNIDSRLGQIQADERKVRQVVLNLLSNAIKFTPEGGRIDVGAMSKDGFIEVSVSDTGIGIAPEDQEKVFEEFRQAGTAAKKVEGTGLGLTLCRKFVELHGGKIWVRSELGTGSTFTFSLPLRSV